MDGFSEGQAVWIEQDDGTQRAGTYVGEVQTTSWLGGGPRAYVVYQDTRSGEEVELPRITPRDDEE
jgi:hypothetical protein